MIISRASIAQQARIDARDELDGHVIHNPYTPGTDAYGVWQEAFTAAWYLLSASRKDASRVDGLMSIHRTN